MEREIWDIVRAVDEKKLTAIDAHKKLCCLYSVSVSFLYDFVNEFTDTEMPKEAIVETLKQLNER